MRAIINFFDRLEDRVRAFLSHWPIFYGLVAGVGIVLFWRGVWHSADMLVYVYMNWIPEYGIDLTGTLWWDGPLSIAVGAAILLVSGVFVSEFIGKEIIISGLRGEKKLTEQTESEVKTEVVAIAHIMEELKQINKKLNNRSVKK
jgi:hypothetical protein